MELIRGPKPYTHLENLFAAEKAKLVRAEIQAVCEMNEGLLNYPRFAARTDFSKPRDKETDRTTDKERVFVRRRTLERSLEKRRRRIAYQQNKKA